METRNPFMAKERRCEVSEKHSVPRARDVSGNYRRTHPPVLPVVDLFRKINGDWWFIAVETDDYFIGAVSLDVQVRFIISALQRCAWRDLLDADWEEVLKIMKACWPEERDWYPDKAKYKINKTESAWAEWGKEGGE